MRALALFSTLLIVGIVVSQILLVIAADSYLSISAAIRFLTIVGLAFIMIDVGREFELDKADAVQHVRDYLVAMAAAALPSLMVSL